ncbi:ribose ABC transporter substrate-binding protein RbsB [Clostridium bowmanii]|uniref:ribose ABC transporter substrate-binding protein RbsB n=1 Tax=Clostridium bowmanii TaxID=132925 RepID=UPI001C0C6680|nr:ribose ABC transporter substrate-binding protein RbsB [Clostridium bowmanii]MBU3190369.1 ribose ABC transporter substrate-binding protein RbsB [Clostridium bowmanii]MCA1074881.1 ribose ABC transporter substrate-binding protein RbsB [Clostridium bowmanii]
MKKGAKLISLILSIALIIGTLAACSSQKSVKDEKKIGMVVSTLNNPFFVSLKEGAEKRAKELGYEVVVLDSQNDASKERANVEDLVQLGITTLIINPTDSDAVVNSIKVANDNNVKVITIDRKSNGGEVVCHVASDNIKGGELAAKFILQKLNGKRNLVELQGIPGSSATRDRGEGFHNIVDKKEGVKVVASQAADFDRQKGLNVTQNVIQAIPKFDAVFAHNDEMALGAIEAIKAENKNVIIVGFDGNTDAITAVQRGEMAATVAQKPDLMGSVAIDNAIKIGKGETVPKEIPVGLQLFKK